MSFYWIAHASAQKLTETTKSLKICNWFSTDYRPTNSKIVCRRSEMTHQQRESHSGSAVNVRAVGEKRQCLPLALVLEEDILSTCCNKHGVMKHVWLFERW